MSDDRDLTSDVVRGRPVTGRLRAVVAAIPEEPTSALAVTAVEGEAIFELLVAVMWSDGELATEEVERGRAAAEVMQVRSSRGGALGAIADGPLPFGQIGIDALSARARRLAYAAAEWLADAVPDPTQRRAGFVRALHIRLGVDADEARALAELALELGRSEPQRPRMAFRSLMR